MRWSLVLRALAAAWLGVTAVHGSPVDLFGHGPRSEALAGTGASDAEGFEAVTANPALLSRCRARTLTLGWQAADFELTAEGPNAPGALEGDAASGTFIGAVLPLPFGGVFEDRIGVGVAAFTPRDLIVRARLLFPERPQFPLLSDRAHTLTFGMGLGVDVGGGVRVGGGALALAELVGTAAVRTDSSGRVGTVVDDQLTASYAPVLGVGWEPDPTFSLGASYRGALVAEFDVVVQVYDLGQLVIPDLHIAGIAQYDPAQLQAEITHRRGSTRVTVGATYKRWSAFPGWARATVQCPREEPDCAALVPEEPRFSDTVVPRLAVEQELRLRDRGRLSLRAGSFFEPTPVPEQTGAANAWDASRIAFSLGSGVALTEPLPPITLDFFVQHHRLLARRHVKSPARLGCAEPSEPACAGNAGFPSVEVSGSVTATGVTVGVTF